MAKGTKHTRRKARSNPRGVMEVSLGGYGFVKTSEGEFFVPRAKMGSAFDGDLVEVALLPPGGPHAARGARGSRAGTGSNVDGKAGGSRAGNAAQGSDDRRAARVVRVVDRAHDMVVGRYEVAEPFGVVVPEDPRIQHDIFTRRADAPDVPDGALVRVRVTQFPTRNSAATGVVEEVLGDADEIDIMVDLIVARHKLETVFSAASLQQASLAAVDAEGALREGYRDVRDRTVFTIDPEDARDFDDALSLDRVDGLWRLGVHIADVSHYVPWDSPIDLDARRRATSVYLVDRVIPMLPEALCNEVCSLKPGVPRRAMTVDLYVDDAARLQRCDMYASLIRSDARLTYGEAQNALEGLGGAGITPAIAERLARISHIAKLRAQQRDEAGGLDFDTREAKVRLDDEGHAVGIELREKNDATQLVEEAMIFANEAVASRLADAEHPCIYRVHEQPAPDALEGLIPVLREFDWFAAVDEYAFTAGDSRAIQAVLKASAGRPEGELVSSLVLRSMQRAVYSPSCEGHYGLASAKYCHFTSPIRRYPDLAVHRMLKRFLAAGARSVPRAETEALGWLSEHSSEMERTADAAARQSQECKMIEYLQDYVGHRFDATVSGVMTYGLYVRLQNTAEGIVPAAALGDEYFALDPVRHTLTGTDTARRFRLGSRLSVVLKTADPKTRTLEFAL